jgi:outer membrane autotransporter protein
MKGIHERGAQETTGTRKRKPKVSSVARAVRSALAASAAALVLAGSGPAFAGDCTAPAGNTIRCNGDFNDTLNFAVEDLTLVVGDEAPTTIAPPAGSAGILADWAGNIGVTSSADILVYDADGIHAVGNGDIDIFNDGSIGAYSFGQAIGIYAYSDGGDVSIANEGTVIAYSYAGLADGIFASGGDVEVANGAGGVIGAFGYDWAAGIEAQGDDAATVVNDGTIYTRSYGAGEAFGVYATGGEGGASIDNTGIVAVRGYDQATGLYAQAGGDVDVANSGAVYAGYIAYVGDNTYSSSYASGIFAASGAEGAAVGVENSGLLQAISFSASSGVEARSTGVGGSVDVQNSGDVVAVALASNGIASGLAASADGDASIDNDGDILAYAGGMTYGAIALAFNGDASVTNSGDITAANAAFRYYSAYGIVSSSQNGAADADNEGSISVYSPYIGVGMEVGGLAGATAANGGDIDADAWVAYGARARSGGGDVSVENSGSIAAHYSGSYLGYSFGMFASTLAGDISVDNSGDISADGGLQGVGIFTTTSAGDIDVDSSGDVDAASYVGTAVGIFARASAGTATIDASGDIDSSATYGSAYGVLARGAYLEATNSGDISATGYYGAQGVYLDGVMYSELHNSGDISASSANGLAAGAVVSAYYGALLSNSGDISASGDANATVVGVLAQAYGDVTVENSGTISATHEAQAIAVALYSAAGTATLENSGTITTDTSVAGAIALLGSYGVNEVHNTGDIHGAVVTFDGDDLFQNGQGGTWEVGNFTRDFGGGDDAIVNGAGGTIHLADGGIFLGSSGAAGNSFENAGTIRTSGYGFIDMGRGVALVPSLNPLPLVNDGIIDFVDGTPDDVLVILGDLGGDGAINVDMSLLNGNADLLYVDGSVVDGTTQAITLSIDGVPTALAGEAAPAVVVTGNVPAGSFVGGDVLNFDPSNFLDLGVSVGTTQAGGLNVVSAAVTVDGLNQTGVLAASVAQGAHSLINSAIGTLRQRNGVRYPLADGQAGLSPWVRFYTEKGDVSPQASGFGSGADFGFEQENRGREVGMGFSLGNASFGILGGNADGTQRIDGVGGDRLKLHGAGLYATWTAPRFYVDLSHRWMDFDARLDSATGEKETSGNATATNVEVGFTGWTAGGIDIVPQVQYTRSKIDNVEAIAGTATQMEIDGGVSERGRVGVALSRSFAGGNGVEWTPYGALSAVREFDGETGFTVADAFSGTTSAEGTSTLAELGIGVRKGGLSATAGVNWADGGALDSVRGGQLVVRYTW